MAETPPPIEETFGLIAVEEYGGKGAALWTEGRAVAVDIQEVSVTVAASVGRGSKDQHRLTRNMGMPGLRLYLRAVWLSKIGSLSRHAIAASELLRRASTCSGR